MTTTNTTVDTTVATTNAKKARALLSTKNKFAIMKALETEYVEKGLGDAAFAKYIGTKLGVTVSAGSISLLRKELDIELNRGSVSAETISALEKEVETLQAKFEFVLERFNAQVVNSDEKLTEEQVDQLVESQQVLAA